MQQPKAKHQLWQFMKPYRKSFYAAVFFKVLSAVMSVLEPLIFGLIITEITANVVALTTGVPDAKINVPYITMVLVIYFLRGVVYSLSSWHASVCIKHAVQHTTRDLRQALSHKINRLPVSYFDGHQFGDMLNRFTADVEAVSEAMQQSILQILNAVISIVLAVTMAVLIGGALSLIVVASIPITYLTARWIMKRSKPYYKQQAHVLGDMNSFVQETLTGFNVIKLYGHEEQSEKDFARILGELEDAGFKASFISGTMMPILAVISNVAYLGIALFGGLQVLAGTLTLGTLQALVQYVWQVNQPIQTITQLTGSIQSAQSSLERIFEVLNESDEEEFEELPAIPELTGQVSFEHVNFQYDDKHPLIKDFTLDVQPGEMIAIVGPTGAGKTTLINLLMRFYDVDSGKITVDGHDIRQLSRQQYRQQFGMVLQDAWLYEGTIEDNLRFGQLQASHEDIVQAAQAANVDHFIRTLPNGYQMMLNQESTNISLGQKQLLTIARALLSDPKILILDEATSSVDTRLELLIQKAMKNLMKGRTSFVIAHRLSTIQEADKIIVLKDGQIIEHGNHESLLAAKGFYHDLYHSQFAKS